MLREIKFILAVFLLYLCNIVLSSTLAPEPTYPPEEKNDYRKARQIIEDWLPDKHNRKKFWEERLARSDFNSDPNAPTEREIVGGLWEGLFDSSEDDQKSQKKLDDCSEDEQKSQKNTGA